MLRTVKTNAGDLEAGSERETERDKAQISPPVKRLEKKNPQIHTSVAHLQCPGCQVNAGTGNAFWLEPDKDICSQAVVHVVPEKQESRRLQGTAKALWASFLGFFELGFTSTRVISFCIQLLDFNIIFL